MKLWIRIEENAAFGKTMENLRRHSNIKLVTAKVRRKFLVCKSNYHKRKRNFGYFVSNRNDKKANNLERTCLFKSIKIGNE